MTGMWLVYALWLVSELVLCNDGGLCCFHAPLLHPISCFHVQAALSTAMNRSGVIPGHWQQLKLYQPAKCLHG